MVPAPLRIRLLGGFEVEGLDEPEVGSRKARTLLKALALARGSAVPAERLAEWIWGDGQPARTPDQLGVLVSRLRGVLGGDRIVRSDGGYALRCDWLDVEELERRVEQSADRIANGAPVAGRAAARAALELARGPLLPGEDGEWVTVDRAAAERLVARARRLAAEAALAAGEPATAASDAEAALDHDPYDEAALRLAMDALLRAGRPGSALACYSRVRGRLADDLGVSPTAETERLYERALRATAGEGAERPVAGAAEPAPEGPDGPARTASLAGRERELAMLASMTDRVRDGEAAQVVIEGEAGIGKTALVERFAADAAASGFVVLSGRCDTLGRDLPLQPVLDAIDARLMALDPEEAARLIAPDAAILGTVLGRAVPTAHAPPPSVPTAVPDADTGRALLLGALLGVVRRMASEAPVVMIIEDLHLGRALTVQWCRVASRRGHRLLLVATSRTGGPFDYDEAIRIELGPLGPEAVAELVGEDRAADLFDRSGGHPLFLMELAAASGPGLPASISASVEERLAALGPAGPTVRAAAVLARDVDLDLLAAATGQPVAEILEHLEGAVAARLLVEQDASFRFAHELVRVALEDGTSASRRAWLHRNAARALTARPGADPTAVARHARLGGDGALAATALVDAARLAAGRFDMAAAAEHLDAAVALSDSIEARLARGRVRLARWHVAAAADDAQAAMAMGGGPAALELAGWAAYYERDYAAAERFADEAVERSQDEGLRASALMLAGRVRHSRGDLAGAADRLNDAVASSTSEVRGVAQVWLASLSTYRGQAEEALDLSSRALLEPDRLGHPFALLHGLFSQIRALGMLGRPAEALDAIDALEAAIERTGQQGSRFRAVAANARGWVLRSLGRFDEADEANRRALAFSLDAPQREPYYAAVLDLAEGRLLAGDLGGTSERLAEAASVDSWQGTMDWHQRDRLCLLRARWALASGRQEEAAALASATAASAAQRGEPRYEALAVVIQHCAQPVLASRDDRLDLALAGLDRLAGLEAWRYTAEAAAATESERLWNDASARLSRLVVAAGPDGAGLGSWAREYMARLRERSAG